MSTPVQDGTTGISGGSGGGAAGTDQNNKRTSITILVLGDEGVGKSSLISTFVSRHFSEVVPGIMTRVRLPPDPENSCITTIVDSQSGDIALSSAIRAGTMPIVPPSSSSSLLSSSQTGLAGIPGGGGKGGITSSSGTGTTATVSGSSGGSGISSNSTVKKNTTASTTATRTAAATTSLRKTLSSSNMITGGVENVDSIILVYDLDRDETFFRLENHWLPLIERCYNGGLPVIVAGSKMDLFLPSSTAGVTDEQVLARSRQQIVSLMQRFRFIRQCIKCSAKNLLRVDEVFLKAQQAVLYPFTPQLYDLDVGKLSNECQRAFTRIFRMYDKDYDGLLSHSELDRFQHETFHVPVYERDLTGWKKVVTRNNPNEEVVREGKFTVAGFLAIFDVFISQNRLDVPWKALRKFGYDDNLNLYIPPETMMVGPNNNNNGGGAGSGRMDNTSNSSSSWKISTSARKFLENIFYQFDADHDGVLSLEEIDSVFSIIQPPSLPLWHPIRAQGLFQGCFSLPKMPCSSLDSSDNHNPDISGDDLSVSQSLSATGITIVSGDSFPTVDFLSSSEVRELNTHVISKPLSFLDWMGLWHTVSAISPAVTRAELFRLGHMEDLKKKKKKRRRSTKKVSATMSSSRNDSLLGSREVRVLLLGSPGSGKTALLNALCCVDDPLTTSKTKTPMTASTHVRLRKNSQKGSDTDEQIVVHLVITDVPEAEAENQALRRRQLSEILSCGNCDLVMLAFDATNSASLAYAKHLEETLLTDEISRVYVATKSDQCAPSADDIVLSSQDDGETKTRPVTVIDEASIHCQDLDIESPLVTSATNEMLSADGNLGQLNRSATLERLARSCLFEVGIDRLRAKPHEESKRRDAARRRNQKMIWLGVGVGMAAAVAGYIWIGATGSKEDGNVRKDRLLWFRSLFTLRRAAPDTKAES